MADQPFLAPTFSPVTYPGADPTIAPDARKSFVYKRRPLAIPLGLTAADAAAVPGEGINQIVVQEPSLVKLGFLPTIALNTAHTMFATWRLSGGGDRSDISTWIHTVDETPFIGPYAWLPEPGLYEILLTVQGPANPVPMQASLFRGVTEQAYNGLLFNAVRIAASFVASPGAGATIDLTAFADNARLFPLYRSLFIQNTGANAGNLLIAARSISLAVGASLQLGQEFLGRHTLRVTSTAGTSFQGILALW